MIGSHLEPHHVPPYEYIQIPVPQGTVCGMCGEPQTHLDLIIVAGTTYEERRWLDWPRCPHCTTS